MSLSKLPTTHCTPFGKYNAEGDHLFAVRPGIALSDALENASRAQHCVNIIQEELAMGDLPDNPQLRWAAVQLGEWSKALIDASMQGWQEFERGDVTRINSLGPPTV
jgi:hypothetical protein